MIIFFIVQSFIMLLGLIVSLAGMIPQVTELPFGIDEVLTTGVGYVKYLGVVIPPIAIMYGGFQVILNFKVVMLVLRLFRIIR